MYIDDNDQGPTLDVTDGGQARAGLRDGLHVREVRPSLDAPQAAGDERSAAAVVVRELQIEVLEHAQGNGEAGTQARRGVRRDDHLRVTCVHCGRRVLTRRSGAMWAHDLDGAPCPGSKTWDY